MKTLSTTKLMAIGSLGILSVILEMAFGTISLVTGIPLASGVVNVFIHPAVLVFTLLLINSTITATVMQSIFGLAALFVPLGGPPGMLLKFPLYLISGLFSDGLNLLLGNRRKIKPLIIGGVNQIYFLFGIIFISQIAGVPGVDRTKQLFLNPVMTVLTFVAGAVGGYFGFLIYQKIGTSAVVARIQGVKNA